MSYLIGVSPVPPQVDWPALVGIGGVLAILLAIAIVLQVLTAPRSGHAPTSTPTDRRLGPAV